MTVDEIFTNLVSHMREGVAMHEQMAQAYDFLSLYGFSKCHTYHRFEEEKGYICLLHYYSTHYHKILNVAAAASDLIPQTWLKYTTSDVDSNTKRQSVKMLMEKWVEWERATKKLYQEMYHELYMINEIAAADKLKCYICDVDAELEYAEKKLIKLNTIDYAIGTILSWQKPMHKKYEKELKSLFK